MKRLSKTIFALKRPKTPSSLKTRIRRYTSLDHHSKLGTHLGTYNRLQGHSELHASNRLANSSKLTSQTKLIVPIIVMVLFSSFGIYYLFHSKAATPVAGDINGDSKVDYLDLAILASNYHKTGQTRTQGNLDGDPNGNVDVYDFAILASNWGVVSNPNSIQVSQLPALLGNFSQAFGPYNSTIYCADQLTSAYDPSINAWRQYFIYGGTNRQPYITSRTLPNGSWQAPVNLKVALGNVDMTRDGHNCLVAAVDSEGYIHVTGNEHAVQLLMARSVSPYSITDFVNVPTMVERATENQVTYPAFFKTSDGTLMLAYRNGDPGSTGKWYLNRWDATNGNPGHWVRVVQLTDASGESFYAWRIAVDRSNTATKGRIHFFGTWRVGANGPGNPIPNEDLLDYYSDDNGLSWRQYGDPNPVPLPIKREDGIRILNSSTTGPGDRFIINNGGLDIDNQGHPHALVNMSTVAGTDIPSLYHVWYDGSRWHLDDLGINKPRSSVFSDNAGNTWGFLSPTANNQILVINLTPGSPGFETQIFPLTKDLDFGALTAIFDSSLLNNQNELSFMFSEMGGADPNTKPDTNFQQPAYIQTIPLDMISAIGVGGITIPHLETLDSRSVTSKDVNATTLQKLLSSPTLTSSSPLFIKLTATAKVSDSSTVLSLRAVKSTSGGDVTFGSLDFNSTSLTTESTPWLPVQLGVPYTGVLSAGALRTAGSGSGTIDSLTITVSALTYP